MPESGGHKPFSLSARVTSLAHATRGLVTLVRDQHNARIHICAALLAIISGWVLRISITEWLVVVLLIGWVLCMEAFNSALEYLCDLISRDEHPLIAKAKDVAAAAVLLSALTAAAAAALIFIPKLLERLIQ